MALQALLLDVDGTLADTERDGHRPAFNETFAAAGLDWRWDDDLYRELLPVTGGKERIRAYCERFEPEFLDRPDAQARIAALHADKTVRYVETASSGRIPLRPGVEALIREAHASGLRLAIATTTSPGNVAALLEATVPGSTAWFEVIGAGDVVAHKKPAPDIYRWVLDRLGVPPQDCLAVEDSAVGLRAASGAGIPVVVTPSPYTAGEDFSAAAAVLGDLAGVTLADLVALHARAPALPPTR